MILKTKKKKKSNFDDSKITLKHALYQVNHIDFCIWYPNKEIVINYQILPTHYYYITSGLIWFLVNIYMNLVLVVFKENMVHEIRSYFIYFCMQRIFHIHIFVVNRKNQQIAFPKQINKTY